MREMKSMHWFNCTLLLLVITAFTNAASFVCHRTQRNSRQLTTFPVLQHVDQDIKNRETGRILSDARILGSILVPLAVIMVPFVATAIDHPVDHAQLGIPIPVPDARYFVSGGLCAAASHGITTPIDVVKTRIQAEPEVFNKGLVSATKSILEKDGPTALLGGLGPTVVGYALEGAMKFGLYESLKPTFAEWLPANEVAAAYLGASVVAGAVASVMLCPMEHTRIRLVTDPTFASGLVSALSPLGSSF
jgi:hypothetical protein